MDLKESHILGERIGNHWYYYAKVAAVRRLLNKFSYQQILDVGAGSGFFSRELLQYSSVREVVCVDTSYVHEWFETVADKKIHFTKSVDKVMADLVLLMDVLEHVDDDVGLLRSYVDQASPGTQFLITVPAFSFLWSGHDIFLEHKRRYTIQQIESVARQSGLTVKHGCYFFGAIFPLAATLRLTGRLYGNSKIPQSNLQDHSPLVNSLLRKLCEYELPFMLLNRAFGLSAFCLAYKAAQFGLPSVCQPNVLIDKEIVGCDAAATQPTLLPK